MITKSEITVNICKSCTDRCFVNKTVAHCDRYKGPLKNVKYNGDVKLYELDLKESSKDFLEVHSKMSKVDEIRNKILECCGAYKENGYLLFMNECELGRSK